jgi:gluconate 2-dehydrogenase gamma chain
MSGHSRRDFLVHSLSGLSAGWVVTHYGGILEAAAYAQQAGDAPTGASPFAFFTPEVAAEVDAMAARIIPTDSTPGAREAHVVIFIDRALVTFERDRQGDYTSGIEALQAQTTKMFPAARAFSALSPSQQDDVLRAIERTPFFNLVRTHTITGFFAHPVHGGNFDQAGWKLIDFDDSLDHSEPFGYYDAL